MHDKMQKAFSNLRSRTRDALVSFQTRLDSLEIQDGVSASADADLNPNPNPNPNLAADPLHSS